MAVLHPRLRAPDETLRWVDALELTSHGIFKLVSSVSASGAVSHHKERFLTWSQCVSGEPINLVVGTRGWRRDGGDIRFDLSLARLASGEELAIAMREIGLQNAGANPFIAIDVGSGTTLVIDSTTLIERVLLQSKFAFDLAASPFRDLFVECRLHDDLPLLSDGCLDMNGPMQLFVRGSDVSGALLRLISWLESIDWKNYFGVLIHSIRQKSAPPLPNFAVTGWLRYDGIRVGNVIFAEYLHAVMDQIGRPNSFAYRAPSRLFSWRISGKFPKYRDGDVDFEHPYSYSMSSEPVARRTRLA